MKKLPIFLAALSVGAMAYAQNPPPTSQPAVPSGFVSREEYERLLRDQQSMREELEQLKHDRAPNSSANHTGTIAQPASQEDLDDVEKQVKAVHDDVDRYRPGTSSFWVGGDASFGFISAHKSNSSFNAGLAPLILWKPNDRILFEGAADLGIDTASDASSSTSVDLTIADASFIVNDWLLVGGGLFVTPFGVYHNHFDPPWINKFPDDPLAFGDGGIAPGSSVGLFAKGAFPIATNSKLTYDVYVSNGPNLITTDPGAAGSLSFDNFSDLNQNKAVGGRIGFLPLPNIEMGYSIMYAKANPSHFESVPALLQAADLNWRQECAFVRGQFDCRTEWMWSDVGRATYDPDGSNGFGPTTFSNYRNGGYVQLCYRPTMVNQAIVRNFELVSRWDYLRVPHSAPGGDTEQRWTAGIDYWLTPYAVLKIAYEWDHKEVGDSQNAFLFQFGIGL